MLDRLREYQGADQVELFADLEASKTPGVKRIVEVMASKAFDVLRIARKPEQTSA
ncbi:hypothetical protein [Oryzicola mucosus]|uniref:Uncharacterized protein n=1 Tax=Oryzicola mucosus TaxID=2767425 RepID=A0A8J6U6K3_9HYPH|nr:hypothetical protein [Oryzicola mucosus]MBD0413217.1 hypothetical protein [Oryzicola mucosus]